MILFTSTWRAGLFWSGFVEVLNWGNTLEASESSFLFDITTDSLRSFVSSVISSERRLGAAFKINGKRKRYGNNLLTLSAWQPGWAEGVRGFHFPRPFVHAANLQRQKLTQESLIIRTRTPSLLLLHASSFFLPSLRFTPEETLKTL